MNADETQIRSAFYLRSSAACIILSLTEVIVMKVIFLKLLRLDLA